MFGIAEKNYQLILETIKDFREIDAAAVHGERIREDFRSGIDIDLVIYGKLIGNETISCLKIILEHDLPVSYFDITHYDSITDYSIKEEIDRNSLVFFRREN